MEEIGNGGMPDAAGIGYECVMDFQDEINAAKCECTNHDSNKIVEHVVLDDNSVFHLLRFSGKRRRTSLLVGQCFSGMEAATAT